jgi:hypothetical protein
MSLAEIGAGQMQLADCPVVLEGQEVPAAEELVGKSILTHGMEESHEFDGDGLCLSIPIQTSLELVAFVLDLTEQPLVFVMRTLCFYCIKN